MSKTIKIIGGTLRGRTISFLEEKTLRPTSSRIRETLFNWLNFDIYQSSCLDLFSGSGSLGIEALSREAKRVDFVDLNKKNCQQIRQHLKKFGLYESSNVFCMSYDSFLAKNTKYYDIVFVDPPYDLNLLSDILNQLTKLKPKWVYLEDNNPLIDNIDGFKLYRHKKAGQVYYGLLKRSS